MKKIPKWAEEYLKLLGLTQELPTYAFLEKLCTAHLSTLPFENISKMIYFRDKQKNHFEIPSIETFIQNHHKYHFGGTCYTLNSSLYQLLDQLGFSCYLIKLGKGHMGILVELDKEKVYVDCGASAPIFRPVYFERDPQNVSQFGEDKVHILPADPETGQYKYVRYIQGKQSGEDWEFNVREKCTMQDFQTIIEQSNEPKTTFMKLLRCQLWQLDKKRSVSLVDNQFSIRYADGTMTKSTLHSLAEIEDVIATEFLLPKLPVREAVEVLDRLDINIFQPNPS